MLWILNDVERLSFSDVSRYLPTLSEDRRLRVRSILHESTRIQSVLAELLLRYALRREYGIPVLPRIETGKEGKPFFPEHPALHFNLSHCKYAVACALDAAPLGVDVQEYRDGRWSHHGPPARTFRRVLSDPEIAWIEAGESPEAQNRRFVQIWTCKEAYGKALGCGIVYELGSTCFLPETELWRQDGFLFWHFPREMYALTLCAASELPIKTLTSVELLPVSESLSGLWQS